MVQSNSPSPMKGSKRKLITLYPCGLHGFLACILGIPRHLYDSNKTLLLPVVVFRKINAILLPCSKQVFLQFFNLLGVFLKGESAHCVLESFFSKGDFFLGGGTKPFFQLIWFLGLFIRSVTPPPLPSPQKENNNNNNNNNK